ncbi:MAG TPA: UdgX family uracil-DNA binding protein [Candidatus Limnocylindrales bacterium]
MSALDRREPGQDAAGTAAGLIPPRPSLPTLRAAAAGCRACDLWARATQTVFGEGARSAEIMLVGEQPGDREDREGHPFVGPAGQLLDGALRDAGIDRERTFVTNVVKHFKWSPVPGSKRRLHERPDATEVRACVPWLEAELAVVEPEALVLLGATAAQALLGPGFRVSRQRGEFVRSPLAPLVMATVHPSSILRARDTGGRAAALAAFVDDLARVPAALAARRVPTAL